MVDSSLYRSEKKILASALGSCDLEHISHEQQAEEKPLVVATIVHKVEPSESVVSPSARTSLQISQNSVADLDRQRPRAILRGKNTFQVNDVVELLKAEPRISTVCIYSTLQTPLAWYIPTGDLLPWVCTVLVNDSLITLRARDVDLVRWTPFSRPLVQPLPALSACDTCRSLCLRPLTNPTIGQVQPACAFWKQVGCSCQQTW